MTREGWRLIEDRWDGTGERGEGDAPGPLQSLAHTDLQLQSACRGHKVKAFLPEPRPSSTPLPAWTSGEKARSGCTWNEHHDFLQSLRPWVKKDWQTELGGSQAGTWRGPLQVGAQGAGGMVSTSDSSPPRDPGVAAPAAAARAVSTMHCCARGHRGGGRRRPTDPRSVHPSFLCQLSECRCSGSRQHCHRFHARRKDARGRER
jgi:hypothetical protein